jgi:S-formylglutathione hydrolase
MEILSDQVCFGGRQLRIRHPSVELGCDMTCAVYLPPAAAAGTVPVLYWLSGLTCDDQNFTTKAGAQRVAAELGMALVAPDTSPRGEGVADDPEGAYDFGLGAGFYVDATQAPFDRHYLMYSYVAAELPMLVADHFPVARERASIAGHSMGGHGALVVALRNPDRYRSVSAFAPICSPTRCPWGQKALRGYLGEDPAAWRAYDASLLIADGAAAGKGLPLLVDQGGSDEFLEEQLKPELLLEACGEAGLECEYRLHTGYDHSYYFIATFIEDHLRWHAGHLQASGGRERGRS